MKILKYLRLLLSAFGLFINDINKWIISPSRDPLDCNPLSLMWSSVHAMCNNNRLLQVMALAYYRDNLVNLIGWWMKTNTVFIYCDRYNTYLMIGKQRDWQTEVKGHNLCSSWGITEGNEKFKCLRMIDVLRIISHAAKLQQRGNKSKNRMKDTFINCS